MDELIKVSVVEDDPYFTFLIKKALNDFGEFDITVFDSANMFLSHYAISKPRFVLLDFYLKGMDGAETLSKLLEIDPDAQVIVLSSQESEEVKAQLLASGILAYIQKDHGWKELLEEQVSNVLKN